MKTLFTTVAAALLLGASPIQAQPASAPVAQTAATAEWVDAEIRRIDAAGRKLTLKHGEIKSLDMPPMTMVFEAATLAPDQWAALKIGDKVQVQVGGMHGRLQVSALRKK